MSKKAWIIVAVLVVVIGGCAFMKSGSQFMMESYTEKMIENATGDKADVDMKDGSMTFTTSEGTFTAGQQGKLPSDWPEDAPAYADATVQYSATTAPKDGKTGMGVVLMTTDSVEDVATFYKTKLVALGWSVENTMQMGSATIIAATKDDRTLGITIAGSTEGTSITMGIETK